MTEAAPKFGIKGMAKMTKSKNTRINGPRKKDSGLSAKAALN